MYPTTKSKNNTSMYHTNSVAALTPISAIVNDPYHWDQPVHVHSHDYVTVSGHSNDSLWYANSVLCHQEQTKGMDNNQSNDSIHRKTLSPHQPSLAYHHSAGPRAVIPSKRAAQNRAAQRAFRQRRERYVKELEKKAKLMDEWKAEMEQLRQQNKELREYNMNLEKQIHQMNSLGFEQQKLVSPIHSPSVATEIIPAPVVVVMDQPTVKSAGRGVKQEPQTLYNEFQASLMPATLGSSDHTNSIGSPTTSCSSSSSFNGLEDVQHAAYQPDQIPWSIPVPNNFDHYANLDFMSGGQDLNTLCAILQTRQRTETNRYAKNNTINYVASEQGLPINQQSDSILLATNF
ncbi:hypothetical protein [Parasitella parasitica]|uniref:BZIP domain-containing protein n=1 Tax=Parasitella parasitica TaxID=35722 RepID=A0A0B7MVY3_9FUNG|nr:hypothetical protein [Parasitella parasitica]